jgi:hypothetical protein
MGAQALGEKTQRDRYFPVTYVFASATYATVSLRSIESAGPRVDIVVEGFASTTEPFTGEYRVSLVDTIDAEYFSDSVLVFNVTPSETQEFARSVSVPRDAVLVGVRFTPLDAALETKTYLIDLPVSEIPVTSSLAFGAR